MIEVLVHQDSPFIGRKRTKKAVRVVGATVGSGGDEPLDRFEQSLSFRFQVSVILYDKTLHRRRIPPHGLLVRENERLNGPPNQPPNQRPRRALLPGS